MGYRPLLGLQVQTLEPEEPSEPSEPVLPSPFWGLFILRGRIICFLRLKVTVPLRGFSFVHGLCIYMLSEGIADSKLPSPLGVFLFFM